jgi:enamine deaminase RidA (YjgF/YER057c/UK114 family)
MTRFALFVSISLLAAAPLAAQQGDTTRAPVRVPTPGGEVVSADARQHGFYYDEWHFAPARVEGNLVFVSGVVVGARDTTALDVAGFEAAARRAWTQIAANLRAAGSSTGDIVDMTTFHVFDSPAFGGTKREHIDAFRRVKDEFVRAPYPTWTGIGVDQLFPDRGLVEIRVIARKR